MLQRYIDSICRQCQLDFHTDFSIAILGPSCSFLQEMMAILSERLIKLPCPDTPLCLLSLECSVHFHVAFNMCHSNTFHPPLVLIHSIVKSSDYLNADYLKKPKYSKAINAPLTGLWDTTLKWPWMTGMWNRSRMVFINEWIVINECLNHS